MLIHPSNPLSSRCTQTGTRQSGCNGKRGGCVAYGGSILRPRLAGYIDLEGQRKRTKNLDIDPSGMQLELRADLIDAYEIVGFVDQVGGKSGAQRIVCRAVVLGLVIPPRIGGSPSNFRYLVTNRFGIRT